MFTSLQYLETRECRTLAQQTEDPEHRKALIETANLYTRTALRMQGPAASKPDTPQAA
jgi:hypothetical protein